MKHCLIAIALLLTGAFTMPDAHGQATKAKTTAKRDTYPLYGKVVAITSRTLTIVRSDSPDAKESKYTVNSATEFVDGEKSATAGDVKVGRWIGGTLKKAEGDGNDTVVKINIDAQQKSATPKGTTKGTTKKAAPSAKK